MFPITAFVITTLAQLYSNSHLTATQMPKPLSMAKEKELNEFMKGFYKGILKVLQERRDQKEPSIVIIQSIFKDYVPQRNAEFVHMVSESSISPDLKKMIIELLNDCVTNPT